MGMNQKESIRRILKEVRVPRSERVELYKDDNIIVVVPLTHRALQKYAHKCQWCINSDLDEWEDYHKGKHAVIIQRNPKKPKIGIKYPIPSEIFTIEHYTDIDSIYNILGDKFSSNEERDDYMDEVTSNINNFATNIVYYSPSNSLYDQEDNYLPSYGYSISDIPNVTPEVIQIMDDYLQKNKEMSLQESIKRILREELQLPLFIRRRVSPEEMEKEFLESFDFAYDIIKRRKLLSTHELSELIYTTISVIIDSIHWILISTTPENSEWYEYTRNLLTDYYEDRITQMYNEKNR